MFASPLLVAALAAFSPAPQEPTEGPSKLLPLSSIGFVEFAGLEACARAANEAPLIALAERLAERALGARPAALFAAEVLPEITEGLRETGLGLREMRALLRGRIALGFGRPVGFDNELLPAFGLVVEIGDDAEGVKHAIDEFVDAITSKGSVAVRTEKLGGIEAQVLHHQSRTGEIWLTQVDNYAIGTVGRGYLAEILRTLRGEQPSICGTDLARRARSDVGEGALAVGAVNLRPISDLLRWYAPYEADPILAALGLGSIDGITFGTAFRDGQSVDVLRLAGELSEDGLLAALGGGRVDPALVATLPADTALVCGLSLDPARLETAIAALVDALPLPARREFNREVRNEITNGLRELGVPVSDLLAMVKALGPDLVLGVTMPAFQMGVPQFPRIVLACRAAQGSEMTAKIAGLCERFGAVVQSQTVDDRTVRWVNVEGAPVRISVAFVEAGDRIVAASDVRYLKELLRAEHGLEFDPATAGDGCFQSSALFAWLRVRENVGTLWQQLAPQVENLLESNEQIPIEPEDLPTPEELHAALRDVSIGIGMDEAGLSIRLASPIGGGFYLAVFGALLEEAATGSRKRTG
ncbi:MAG: hypothetical protein IT457_17800 [Planctomycetes bacterium]|nr:hypothetical protein [Planctomycetota bacterium]